MWNNRGSAEEGAWMDVPVGHGDIVTLSISALTQDKKWRLEFAGMSLGLHATNLENAKQEAKVLVVNWLRRAEAFLMDN